MLLCPLTTCTSDSAPVGRPSDRYIYDRGAYNLLCTMLEGDWDNILERCSLNMWHLIKNRIKDSMDIAIPKRMPHSTSSKPRPMWMQQILLIKSEGSIGPGIGTVEQGRENTTISMSGLGISPDGRQRMQSGHLREA